MTTILIEMHKQQKEFYSIQAVQASPQVPQIEGPLRICGLCSSTVHYTDQCHRIQEDYTLAVANVNYNNHPPYQNQGHNNYSHGNNSNQGWRDNAQGNHQANLTEMVSRLVLPSSNNIHQPSSSSNLPSQPLPNPKGILNAITLRSGTTLEKIPPRVLEDIQEKEVAVEAPHEEEEVSTRQEEEEMSLKEPKRKATTDDPIPIPFPSMIKKAKKAPEFDLNMLQVFKKVEVTIPLLDAIQQILKYAKFLKDLCTHKDRIGELEMLSLGNSISALMKPILEKFDDPGPCLVSCCIGRVIFPDCMCDLGACVSIMPLSVFARLNLAPLKRLAARFALADKSIITVMGIA
nr:uncharacterized protein LOC112729020 [Arachis hypogaea]